MTVSSHSRSDALISFSRSGRRWIVGLLIVVAYAAVTVGIAAHSAVAVVAGIVTAAGAARLVMSPKRDG